VREEERELGFVFTQIGIANFFFQIEDCLFILHVPGYHTMALLPGTCLPSNIDIRLNIILGPHVYVLDADP
jgi:hypothetical protein